MKRTTMMLIVAATVPVFGQNTNTTATTVQGHRLGETFSEWLAVSRLDPVAACQKKPEASALQRMMEVINSRLKGSDGFDRSERDQDRKQLCKSLQTIATTHSGEFRTDHTTWMVSNGKIVEADMTFFDTETTPEQQIGFLKEKYGEPAEHKVTTYQNAFGAIWHCPEPIWITADGGAIITHGISLQDLGHGFKVVFLSAEQRKIAEASQNKKNPY